MHDHHNCVERTGHAPGMEPPEGMPERHILGRTREAEAARIAAAFVAWLRDQATGEGLPEQPRTLPRL